MKKYKVGYIAGVFDLFHIGHLNLLRNAKAECEYLIVGVLTDELVVFYKKKPPFIPCNERKDIIDSIKYVDQTVLVDKKNIGKMKAWELYHFDCLFSGNDWQNEKSWLEDRKKLNEVGSDIFFFPYTQSTSSTQIKKLITKSLPSNEKIIIFGAGSKGRKALHFYGDERVAYFVDNDTAKVGSIVDGHLVISFDDLLKLMAEYKIMISATKHEDIAKQLLRYGIHNFEVF
ncbi:adenylyltransferase/cytidyltransferase family protein [Desulfitobacterium hafniense]|uniref:adenylyltransferase/cytidyltransferase family protein n=1 Tax=Desulfitobacterium hafniense TaxID=49338 RepID=UPI00037BA899